MIQAEFLCLRNETSKKSLCFNDNLSQSNADKLCEARKTPAAHLDAVCKLKNSFIQSCFVSNIRFHSQSRRDRLSSGYGEVKMKGAELWPSHLLINQLHLLPQLQKGCCRKLRDPLKIRSSLSRFLSSFQAPKSSHEAFYIDGLINVAG